MVLTDFSQLDAKLHNLKFKPVVALAAADDKHALEAVIQAWRDKMIDIILVGTKTNIEVLLKELGESHHFPIIDTHDEVSAAFHAVKLIRERKADFLMKGKLTTATLLKAVVDKEKGLNTGKIMSLCVLNQIPNYHKLLITTDGGMVPYPTLEQKKQILQNSLNVLFALGYSKPKVGILAAVETENSSMPETVDALALKTMNQDGEIIDCIIEGPISYDLAISKQSAQHKGYSSAVAGDVDILLAPNIAAGNILGKCLLFSANAKMAGIVVGADAPIVLTSRGATSEEKHLSIILAAVYASLSKGLNYAQR